MGIGGELVTAEPWRWGILGPSGQALEMEAVPEVPGSKVGCDRSPVDIWAAAAVEGQRRWVRWPQSRVEKR